MSDYSPSRRFLSRIISSIVMMIVLFLIFGFTVGFSTMGYYAILIGIYLVFMIPRYLKIRKAEQAIKEGDYSKGTPKINPAIHKYPNGFGQPTSANLDYSKQDDNWGKLSNSSNDGSFCENCGEKLPFDGSFCENCGYKLS